MDKGPREIIDLRSFKRKRSPEPEPTYSELVEEIKGFHQRVNVALSRLGPRIVSTNMGTVTISGEGALFGDGGRVITRTWSADFRSLRDDAHESPGIRFEFRIKGLGARPIEFQKIMTGFYFAQVDRGIQSRWLNDDEECFAMKEVLEALNIFVNYYDPDPDGGEEVDGVGEVEEEPANEEPRVMQKAA